MDVGWTDAGPDLSEEGRRHRDVHRPLGRPPSEGLTIGAGANGLHEVLKSLQKAKGSGTSAG